MIEKPRKKAERQNTDRERTKQASVERIISWQQQAFTSNQPCPPPYYWRASLHTLSFSQSLSLSLIICISLSLSSRLSLFLFISLFLYLSSRSQTLFLSLYLSVSFSVFLPLMLYIRRYQSFFPFP